MVMIHKLPNGDTDDAVLVMWTRSGACSDGRFLHWHMYQRRHRMQGHGGRELDMDDDNWDIAK